MYNFHHVRHSNHICLKNKSKLTCLVSLPHLPEIANYQIPNLVLQYCWQLSLLCFSCPHCHHPNQGNSHYVSSLPSLFLILHTDGSEICKYCHWVKSNRCPPIWPLPLRQKAVSRDGGVRVWAGVGGKETASIRGPGSGTSQCKERADKGTIALCGRGTSSEVRLHLLNVGLQANGLKSF